jgi:putative transposase
VNQFKSHTTLTELRRWVGVPGSVYYYRPKKGKAGRKPSTHTFRSGELISNIQVVEDIKAILSQPYVCYGYENVTVELRRIDYYINEKKVYRLMDENNLLLGKVIKTTGKRQFVMHRKIAATKPMEYLCLDIKYIWVDAEKRHYYLLSIMDVYSRKIIEWLLQRSIRKMDVINLLRKINTEHGIKGVTIRNDNGSQFIANDVKMYLKTAEAKQEFTHIATPEENAYIEAFHSILQRELISRYEFTSGYDAKVTLQDYMKWYNYKRNHRKLGFITPQQKWENYQMKNNLLHN